MKVENFEIKEYSRRNSILNKNLITYQEFLKSEKWHDARNKLFIKYGKICKICGSKNKINVHHNNYNEKNLSGSIRCLVVLCNDCHKELHRISKLHKWYYKKSMRSLEKRFKKYGSIYYYPQKVKLLNNKK